MTVTLATLDELRTVVADLLDHHPRPLVVNRADAARMLAISDTAFGRLLKNGVIHPVPNMNPKRYSIAALEAFVSGADGSADPTGTDHSFRPVSPLPSARQAGDRRTPQPTAPRGRTPGDAA
jgi:hypothetical protein